MANMKIGIPVVCHNGHPSTWVLEIVGLETKDIGPTDLCTCPKWSIGDGWRPAGEPFVMRYGENVGRDMWPVGSWLSAALDDPSVCEEMKADIREWFEGGGSVRVAKPHADLHPATDDLVNRFAAALKNKLAAAEKKYGYSDGWLADDWRDDLVRRLGEHVDKGDPRDVAAFCAFAWHHGWGTA